MLTFLLEPEMNKSNAATAFLLSKAAKSPFSAAGARSTILAPYEVLARYLVDALTAPSANAGAKGARQTPTEATAPTILLIFIWKAIATANTAKTTTNRNMLKGREKLQKFLKQSHGNEDLQRQNAQGWRSRKNPKKMVIDLGETSDAAERVSRGKLVSTNHHMTSL